MGGNGSIAVCFLTEPLAITSAMTNATTSSTAEPAANHNQRGVLGPCGGGGVSPSGGKSARWGLVVLPVLRQLLGRTGLVGAWGPLGRPWRGPSWRPRRGNVTAVRGCIRRLVGVSRVGGRRIGGNLRSGRPVPGLRGTKPLGATWIVHVHLMACRVPALGAGALMYPATSQPGEL